MPKNSDQVPFAESLARAMRAAGVDPGAVRVTDWYELAPWGNEGGYLVEASDEQIRARAVAWVQAWARRHHGGQCGYSPATTRLDLGRAVFVRVHFHSIGD